MRRVLSLLVAALPALAVAQSQGTAVLKTNSNANLTTLNRAQCSGTASNDAVSISDDVTASLTWTTQPAPDTSFSTSGKYQIWVTQSKPAAGQTKDSKVQTSCATDLNAATITRQQLGSDVAVTSNATVTVDSVSLATLMQKAGVTDCAAGDVTFYVCVQQIDSGKEIGFAVATLSLDSTLPPAPTQVSATPGDSLLHVSCHAGSGDSESSGVFKAKATPRTAGEQPKFSGENASCSDLKIGGLTNFETYDVVVYRLDDNHNPSAASAPPVAGQPIPTHDYWDQCRLDGCPEQGGCATGGLAAGIAGAFSILVALRRRKS